MEAETSNKVSSGLFLTFVLATCVLTFGPLDWMRLRGWRRGQGRRQEGKAEAGLQGRDWCSGSRRAGFTDKPPRGLEGKQRK